MSGQLSPEPEALPALVRRRVGVLIFPGFQLLSASGPLAAFESANRLGTPYELIVLADSDGVISSSCGVGITATSLYEAPPLDTLIVAGGEGALEAAGAGPVVPYLWLASRRARRIASVCTGAFVLAAAGLLDGRRATTHWSQARQFLRRFPRVRLEANRIYIREDSIWTSAGVSAGIDLSLALIAEDAGEAFARRVAQQLVVEFRRPGGQSQFAALPEPRPGERRFAQLLRWIREHLDQELTVTRLAAQLAISPRQFARDFVAEVGETPARVVARLRLEAARERLESGTRSIDHIAAETGFGSTERMRRAFIRTFGRPPQALRRAAGR